MNTIKLWGKYLDQPILIKKFEKSVPYILGVGGSSYCIKDTMDKPKGAKKNNFIRTFATMSTTIASALAAPRIAKKIFHTSDFQNKKLIELVRENTELISNFIKDNEISQEVEKMLKKSMGKAISIKYFKHLITELEKTNNGKKLIDKLIPEPENITSTEIFSKIGELSLLGFIPVLGGIIGGIIGDKLTTKSWKSKIPDKIKEGSYQYLANIFLCNIGAGIALAILEKNKIKSKSARAIGMIGGILTTGVFGGSIIANIIGQKIINPLIKQKTRSAGLYSERKPEAIDIGLHTDDIATVAVMSGLKWIEPALPIMYSVSGYRSGIGYRNNK